jgi:hypothetical protein
MLTLTKIYAVKTGQPRAVKIAKSAVTIGFDIFILACTR